ncbi:unnamed protein product [Schistocephalus solidus]|uniref:Plug domain-containing protein n=1 Tax=Schistocephalus solidus TaxID=70667 RepID=A0A183T0W1_SCHSO|nr:unnamed protein product [Schistocephalus solidus]
MAPVSTEAAATTAGRYCCRPSPQRRHAVPARSPNVEAGAGEGVSQPTGPGNTKLGGAVRFGPATAAVVNRGGRQRDGASPILCLDGATTTDLVVAAGGRYFSPNGKAATPSGQEATGAEPAPRAGHQG